MHLIPDAATNRLVGLATQYGRTPTEFYLDSDTGPVLVFEPPLNAQEQAALDDLRVMAAMSLDSLTLAEYRARKADIDLIKAYMPLASPTNAQTMAAFRALVRVTGAMLKVQLG